MTPTQIIIGGTVVVFVLGGVFVHQLRSDPQPTGEAGTPPSPHGTDTPEERR
jgi:hypothetical protein